MSSWAQSESPQLVDPSKTRDCTTCKNRLGNDSRLHFNVCRETGVSAMESLTSMRGETGHCRAWAPRTVALRAALTGVTDVAVSTVPRWAPAVTGLCGLAGGALLSLWGHC